MLDEEQAVRTALHDLTALQPAAPYDRLDGVRAHHARHRRHQAVVATASLAVVVVLASLAIVTGVNFGHVSPQPASRPGVPSWALQWPERVDRTIPQSVLDGAVRAWRSFDGAAGGATGTQDDPFYAPRQVIWYVAQKAANDSQIVVMFEVERADGTRRLVAGNASASEVANGQPPLSSDGSQSPWVLYDVDAPSPSRGVVIGMNVASASPAPGEGPDDVAIVMADPRARAVVWQATNAAGSVAVHEASMTDGYVEFDAGQVRSRVLLTTVVDGQRRSLARNVYVGVPGSDDSFVPQLAQVPEFVDYPSTVNSLGDGTGQGDSSFDDESAHGTGVTTVYAQCYGGASIRVVIDRAVAGQTVSIPCDDREHVVSGPHLLAAGSNLGQGHGYDVHATKLTAWRVGVVYH